MIPSVKKLEATTMVKSKPRYRLIWLYRKLGVRFAWLLLHTPITANGVSFLAILSGILGCLMLMVGRYNWYLAGAVVLFIYFVLDRTDGNVARYYKHRSVGGELLEGIFHNHVAGLIYLSLGIGAYNQFGSILYFYAGALGSLAHFAGRLVLVDKWRLLLQHTKRFDFHHYDVIVKRSKLTSIVMFLFAFPNLHVVELTIVAAALNKVHWLAAFYGAQMPLRVGPFIWRVYTDLQKETKGVLDKLNKQTASRKH